MDTGLEEFAWADGVWDPPAGSPVLISSSGVIKDPVLSDPLNLMIKTFARSPEKPGHGPSRKATQLMKAGKLDPKRKCMDIAYMGSWITISEKVKPEAAFVILQAAVYEWHRLQDQGGQQLQGLVIRPRPDGSFILGGAPTPDKPYFRLYTQEDGSLPTTAAAGLVPNYGRVFLHEIGHYLTRFRQPADRTGEDGLVRMLRACRASSSQDAKDMLQFINARFETHNSRWSQMEKRPQWCETGGQERFFAHELAAELWAAKAGAHGLWRNLRSGVPGIEQILDEAATRGGRATGLNR